MNRNVVFLSTALATILMAGAAFAEGGRGGYPPPAPTSGGNYTNAEQYGTSQTLSVDQSGGALNVVGKSGSSVYQENGSGSGYNALTITQTGSGNSFGYYARSYQSGTRNSDTVSQSGHDSSVEAIQVGSYNGYSGVGGSYITQDSTTKSSDVKATTIGNYDNFHIRQGGTNNATTAAQSGNGNLVEIVQSGGGFGYFDGNTISTSQTGNDSYGSVSQSSRSNRAALNQSDNNSKAYIIQSNYNNEANLYQLSGSYNLASINQSGQGNAANLWQTSTSGSSAYVTQTGDINNASLKQTGGSGDYGNINQSGYHNLANLEQNSTSGSTAYITQGGDLNRALLTQTGGSNDNGSIYQSGSYNTAQLTQSGSGYNTGTITQASSYNQSYLNQNGSGHTATIKQ